MKVSELYLQQCTGFPEQTDQGIGMPSYLASQEDYEILQIILFVYSMHAIKTFLYLVGPLCA